MTLTPTASAHVVHATTTTARPRRLPASLARLSYLPRRALKRTSCPSCRLCQSGRRTWGVAYFWMMSGWRRYWYVVTSPISLETSSRTYTHPVLVTDSGIKNFERRSSNSVPSRLPRKWAPVRTFNVFRHGCPAIFLDFQRSR